ncbi:MAG: HAD-IA family hydrolase [Bacteroidota bacterium]
MKHILLDLGGVVFESTGRSNEKINWKEISRLNHIYGHGLNIGEDLFGVFLEEYNQATHQHLGGNEFLAAIFDTLHFNQALIDLLQPIGPIYILSDNYRENIAYISQRFHFSTWAQKQFYSFDFGTDKNDSHLFEQLIASLQIPPQDLLFIDDSPQKLAAAARLGIEGIRFVDNEQVRNDLITRSFL